MTPPPDFPATCATAGAGEVPRRAEAHSRTMPSSHPYGDDPVQANIYLPLTVAAFVFGTAMLLVDYRAGSGDHRLLLFVGLFALLVAIGLGIAASRERRRQQS